MTKVFISAHIRSSLFTNVLAMFWQNLECFYNGLHTSNMRDGVPIRSGPSNTVSHIAVDESRLKALENNLVRILQMVEADNTARKTPAIGDWVHEEEVYRLTNLGRTTLYKLRKQGVLSSSTLVNGKGHFYRLSEIEALLYERQKMKK